MLGWLPRHPDEQLVQTETHMKCGRCKGQTLLQSANQFAQGGCLLVMEGEALRTTAVSKGKWEMYGRKL